MGFLSGIGQASDVSSQTGTGGAASSGDLAGTTGTVTAAANGGLANDGSNSASSGLPATPTASLAPTTANPNAAASGASDPLDQLVSMRINTPSAAAAPDAASRLPTTSGSGAPTGLGGGSADQLLTDAKSFLGTPYVYGGTSAAGLDCSGFTQAAYAKMGISIGRDTSAQFASGQKVGTDGNWAADVQQLQPGDLIFYGAPGAVGQNAHVVMYMGNGQIIQAAHTGTNVAVGNLFNAASSDEPFLGVRRYLQPSSNTPQNGTGMTGNYASIVQQHPINNTQDFASDLASALGINDSPGFNQAVIGWENAEGGNFHNPDTYNELNTTQPYGGSHGTNAPGVQAYNNPADGLAAIVQTLNNGRYGNILKAMASGNAAAIEQAVAASPWGTGAFSF